ncbi:MAG: FAD-binding protein, partial [Sphaerochaetaceae bacterium]|nr:FAD-binding protein [Sphaerochaetaceae bacterium]
MKEISSYKGLPVLQSKVVVLGTGAAGLNAADLIYQQGVRDLVIITESLIAGTSRNTGSDKQTYYKLSLAGSDSDSVRSMAEDLFNGRCVDGDIALAEAASSAPGFIRLAQLGVPFPVNRYGEYIGYKTDHDNHRRATSAGPYTSRYMTERLEDSVKSKGIEILDGKQAIRIL